MVIAQTIVPSPAPRPRREYQAVVPWRDSELTLRYSHDPTLSDYEYLSLRSADGEYCTAGRGSDATISVLAEDVQEHVRAFLIGVRELEAAYLAQITQG